MTFSRRLSDLRLSLPGLNPCGSIDDVDDGSLEGVKCEANSNSTDNKCILVDTKATQVNQDATNIPAKVLQQPLLDPQEWFLTEDEITASRGGIPRKDLETFSLGNKVTTFSVSNEFFSSVHKDLVATKSQDRVLFSGWSTNDVPFEPLGANPKETTFKKVFGGAIERDVQVRGLIWTNKLEPRQNVEMRNWMNNLPSPTLKNTKKTRFVFDDRVPNAFASHHQKTIVIEHDHELLAYVGGIDLTSDRWDTITHDQKKLRENLNIAKKYNGWIDASLKIEGPGAKDVAANFVQRWNAKDQPTQDVIDELVHFKNKPFDPLLPFHVKDSNEPKGTHDVQIVRTFSAKYPGYKEFSPKGEISILASRLKAIRNAKNFIYIEDQYFIWVPQLLEALLEVLPRIQRVIVVAQHPVSDSKRSGYEKYLYEMVRPLRKQFPNKVQIYTNKKNFNLYIHSKVLIVDDVYLSTGSANWNRRSMTSDTELNANVVDRTLIDTPDGIKVNQLARDFRLRKFHEHTGISYEELNKMAFLDAANAFEVAAKNKKSLIEHLRVGPRIYFKAIFQSFQDFVDPDDSI